jgi:transposase InsO family protein
VAKLTINELHCALGYVAQGAVQHAVKQGLIEGVELDSASTPEFHDACTKAKAMRQPFPAETTNRACTYGELVHTDLWGPTQTESVTGHLYYISFTNDFSREMKVHFLKLKSEALSTLKDYETELRCQTPGAKIKKLRSDRGREYLSMEFDRYLKDQGIKCQLTVHHSPQQNGVTEHLNCTLVEHA